MDENEQAMITVQLLLASKQETWLQQFPPTARGILALNPYTRRLLPANPTIIAAVDNLLTEINTALQAFQAWVQIRPTGYDFSQARQIVMAASRELGLLPAITRIVMAIMVAKRATPSRVNAADLVGWQKYLQRLGWLPELPQPPRRRRRVHSPHAL